MDYSRPLLADRLAAEYVLGTLRGPALRRMQSLLPAHPALREAVVMWQARLMPLTASVQPVAPSADVWRRIEQRLFAGDRAVKLPWWQRLVFWQGVASLATVAAMALGVVLSQPADEAPAQAPIIIVMQANPDAADAVARPASFVASVSADGRALLLRPLHGVSLTPAQALELWAVPVQGAPRSLGTVSPNQATTVLRSRLLTDTAAFAVSLEPVGGSPTGKPTGPILSLGKLTS